jgi:hypothetical protein
MKVKGQLNPDTGQKDYMIYTGSESFLAERRGSKWLMDGKEYGSLKECKEAAAEDRVEEVEEAVHQLSIWDDCVHPCALLILHVDDIESKPEIMRTLDLYGWLSDGHPDKYMAQRNKDRICERN